MTAGTARPWVLRSDLQLLEAESGMNGPAILVYDPVAEAYDRVEWPESDLLRLLRQPISTDALLERFKALSPLRPTRQDVANYIAMLGRKGWLRGNAFWPKEFRRRHTGFSRRAASLLFLQIPLLRPEGFLAATAGIARAVFNPLTRLAILLAAFFGVYLTLSRWEEYWSDSLGSLDWRSLPAFLFALVIVKAVHEFGHAYAATFAGARVPVMGVALFFAMPLPFTDVTDAWRLPWKKRLAVATAGLRSELSLGGLALLLWALSPPGAAAVALARLSSVALASTFLSNLNPGPRFDGYFILCCLLRRENLRQRGGEMLREWLGTHLFGLRSANANAPDMHDRWAIMLFAAYSVFYRMSLGLGLVAMSYHFLPRAFGVPAAALTAWLFLIAPVVRILVAAWKERGAMRMTWCLVVVLLLVVAAGIWLAGSWPRRTHFPAVTRAEVEEALRTRAEGEVTKILAGSGDIVESGQVVLVVERPWREAELSHAEARLREAELAEERGWHAGTRSESPWRGAEVKQRKAELDAVFRDGESMEARAPVDGTIAVWNTDLEEGTAVGRGELLGWVTAGGVRWVTGYVPVEMVDRLETGENVRFYGNDGAEWIGGEVALLETARVEVLEHPQLAMELGATRNADGAFVLSRPYVKVGIHLREEAGRVGQTGKVWMWTRPEALTDRLWNWLQALAVRESGF